MHTSLHKVRTARKRASASSNELSLFSYPSRSPVVAWICIESVPTEAAPPRRPIPPFIKIAASRHSSRASLHVPASSISAAMTFSTPSSVCGVSCKSKSRNNRRIMFGRRLGQVSKRCSSQNRMWGGVLWQSPEQTLQAEEVLLHPVECRLGWDTTIHLEGAVLSRPDVMALLENIRSRCISAYKARKIRETMVPHTRETNSVLTTLRTFSATINVTV